MDLIADEVKRTHQKFSFFASRPKKKRKIHVRVSLASQADYPSLRPRDRLRFISLSGREILPDLVEEDPGASELFSSTRRNSNADETTTLDIIAVKQPSLS